MIPQSVKDEVAPLIPLDSGGSYLLMWQMLYDMSILKYVRQSQLKNINPRYAKIGSKKKLEKLCDLKYLKNSQDDIFIATNKTHSILEQVGYDRTLLPVVSGNGGLNETRNTEAFIKLMKEPFFLTFLYPRFPKEVPYLIPDAMMVLKKDDKYKLQFLEIEASKYNWEQYIKEKRDNYLRLARDEMPYLFWRIAAKKLGLPIPKKSEFFFSVLFVGDITFDTQEDYFEFKRG